MDANALKLEPMAGPPVDVFRSGERAAFGVGRSPASALQLDHKAVSRSHALFQRHGETWFVTDLDSRHGTSVNGQALRAWSSRPLSDGDLVRVWPWTLRVGLGAERSTRISHITDDTDASQIRVGSSAGGSHTAELLDLLVRCTDELRAADSDDAVAGCALDTALAGTRLERAALIRPLADDQVEVIESRLREGATPGARGFSRSLIRAARNGQIASLTGGDIPVTGESIARMGLQAAICAPVFMGDAVSAYLYIDSTEGMASLRPEACEFGGAVAQLLGLAWSSAKRAEAEQRHAELNAQLLAAREAQRLLVPPSEGEIGAVRYACAMLPGIMVAGDLFDVIDLGEGRVAAFLGDVTGKGVGSSLLMAATQSSLHTALARRDGPREAIRMVNEFLCERSAPGLFVTVWLAVFDTESGEAEIVDAGHGHAMLRRADGAAEALRVAGGPPLGIDAGFGHESQRVTLEPGDRIVVFSDGVVEQPALDGEHFGYDRVAETIDGSATPKEDIDRLVAAIREHAGGLALGDDTTIASIERRQ